jgi:vancomycin resistance protein YoaR
VLRTRTAVLGLLATTGLGIAAVGTAVAVRAGEALPGTAVAGIDVGGLGPDDVRDRLADLVSARTTGTFELVHEERSFTVDRDAVDAEADVEATVDAALDAGRTGALSSVVGPLLGPLLGWERSVSLTVAFDDNALRARVDAIGDELDAAPFVGGLAIEGTDVAVQPPVDGRALDRDRALRDLEQALARGRQQPLRLPVDEEQPGTTLAQVEQVAAEARVALEAPYRLVNPQASIATTPTQLAPLLRAEPVPGPDDPTGLRLGVDREALTELVTAKARAVEQPARAAGFDPASRPPVVDTKGDLTWSPQPAQLTVVPSVQGLAVDLEPAVQTLLDIIGTTTREGALRVGATDAELTTEEAGAAGVTSLVGTFTTYYTPGQPRAQNIARIAEIVDGAYIAPGEQFSLNGHVGPRTRAKGFVADGAIIDGELVDVVGGGVSQFATTLFNAAFFAGVPIPAHQPHSFYISRYPAGRESTVNFGSIDVKVRNDTARGLVIKTWTTRSSVTVALYGDNGGRVVASSSGPRQARSNGGFRIEVTRTVSGGDGRGDPRRVFTWTYKPPPED